MKRLIQTMAVVVAAFSLVVGCDEADTPSTVEGAGGTGGVEGQGPDAAVENPEADAAVEAPDGALDSPDASEAELDLNDEIIGLLFVREEEKLARDVYLHLAEVWEIQTFSNIARAEQTHMDAVLAHLVALGMDDPAEGNGPGVFTDVDIQGLYDDLTEQGEASPAAALTVGAFVEEYDILDLIMRSEEATNQDVIDTYAQLERGSESHLRAFVRGLDGEGMVYAPVLMEQAAYDAIIAGGR
jgi:hypothetical protein